MGGTKGGEDRQKFIIEKNKLISSTKMFSLTTLAVVASSAVTQVVAHGGVLSYSWDNQWYWGWQPYNRCVSQIFRNRLSRTLKPTFVKPDWSDHHSEAMVELVCCLQIGNNSMTLNLVYSNPIQDATVDTLACNDDGTSGALQMTATVAAGTPITAYWNQSKARYIFGPDPF